MNDIGPIFEGQAVQEECREHLVGSYIGNGVGGDWFWENVMLANRVSGVWSRRKGGSPVA
jgi:hypothetical protein